MCDSDPNIFGLMRTLETKSARIHTADKHGVNFSLSSPLSCLVVLKSPAKLGTPPFKIRQTPQGERLEYQSYLTNAGQIVPHSLEVVTVQPICVSSGYEQFAAYVNRGLCMLLQDSQNALIISVLLYCLMHELFGVIMPWRYCWLRSCSDSRKSVKLAPNKKQDKIKTTGRCAGLEKTALASRASCLYT